MAVPSNDTSTIDVSPVRSRLSSAAAMRTGGGHATHHVAERGRGLAAGPAVAARAAS